ncbi:WD40 repeat-like protein [Mycena floridula]|nr:WD40 repeat-like protein [Mycena floridula]
MRRASSQSLVGTSTVPPFPELSAKYHLRNTKTTIDFSLPPAPEGESPLPLALSAQNVLYFSRANRIQFKNLNTSEDIGQLCKLQNGIGDLKIIECGGIEKVDHIALASTKGTIQIWDVRTKKILSNWSTKGVAAMKWNGCLLTIGSAKGTIRYYDTRISPASKMKEQARKMTRHQSCITNLAWNPEGKLLASADDTGTIYCWDHRQKVPLDVGEFVQRRKKMQHAAAVSALSWCPWQAKVLASGDKAGTIRLWNIDASNSGTNAIIPGKVETVSSVVSLHFSPQCKEFIAVHGSGPVVTEPVQRLENAISVYSYPGLRDVITLPVSDKSVAGSVMNNAGTKVVLAVPEENKLKVWDAWGKNKELRRQSSFMSASVIR